MNEVFKVSIDVVTTKEIKWKAWKGAFAGKIVRDSLKVLGIDKPLKFRTIPPRKFSPVLKSGDSVSFEVVFWGENSEDVVGALIEGLASLTYVFPKMVEIKEFELEGPELDESEEPVSVFFTIHHGPTYYVYRGARVPLPSARRLVYSMFRRIWEASGVKVEEVKDLADALEVAGGRPAFSRYKLGPGDEVLAFHGNVKYYGVMDKRLASLLRWGLRYLPLLGNGSLPEAGFGDVIKVSLSDPPFEAPAAGWGFNEEYTL